MAGLGYLLGCLDCHNSPILAAHWIFQVSSVCFPPHLCQQNYRTGIVLFSIAVLALGLECYGHCLMLPCYYFSYRGIAHQCHIQYIEPGHNLNFCNLTESKIKKVRQKQAKLFRRTFSCLLWNCSPINVLGLWYQNSITEPENLEKSSIHAAFRSLGSYSHSIVAGGFEVMS